MLTNTIRSWAPIRAGCSSRSKTSNLAADATLTLTFDYAKLGITNIQVMYFNVADNQYEAIPQNDFVNDPANETLTLTLNVNTTPALWQVVHTVFTITLIPLPVPQVTQAACAASDAGDADARGSQHHAEYPRPIADVAPRMSRITPRCRSRRTTRPRGRP